MPLTTIVKRLRMKMASLQSPRTQCCCCAVGVFAAMFGIFMLSAGICIVLNVTFMEVDTSGLPPELHNEDGKKVVGIILICVAIGALGLSATVSVLYFTFCSRKDTPPASTATANQQTQNQQGHGSRSSHHNGGHRLSGLPGGSSDRDRPGSRISNQSASQTSLRSQQSSRRPQSQASIDGAQFSRSAMPPPSGSRGHPGGQYRHGKKRKSHPIRPGRYRSGLEPHIEEDQDPESARPDLSALGQKGAIASPSSPPAIVIDQIPQESFTPMSTVSSGDYYMETPFNDTVQSFDEDGPLSSTFDEHSSAAAVAAAAAAAAAARADAERQEHCTSQLTDSTILETSSTYSTEFNTHDKHISKQPVVFSVDSRENSDIRPSSSSSSQQTIGIDGILPANRTASPPQSLPVAKHQHQSHHVVKVQPPIGGDLDTPRSSSNTLDMLDQYEEYVEENDRLPELPSSSHPYQIETTEQDSRCESQASYNSGFSFDGDDPQKSDIDKLNERMEKLL